MSIHYISINRNALNNIKNHKKTIEGRLKKGYFIKLPPRVSKVKDLKIRNIRPSEELIADFINWNIDAISILNNSWKYYYKL